MTTKCFVIPDTLIDVVIIDSSAFKPGGLLLLSLIKEVNKRINPNRTLRRVIWKAYVSIGRKIVTGEDVVKDATHNMGSKKFMHS